jgi:dipeptidase E
LPPERRRPRPTILAMGGGGFSAGRGDPPLDRLVLDLTGSPSPRICLLPTAGGDSESQIRRFHETFADTLCEPSDVSLFRLGRNPVPLREHLLAQDAIYVGGGSMVNLLAIWRAQGVDEILRDAWRAGVVLAGLSAGSMCWFRWGVTTSSGAPAPTRGLGFLPGSNSVHHDSEPARLPVFRASILNGAIPPGWAVDDGAALLFRGTALVEVVTARPEATAHLVTPRGVRAAGARVLADAPANRSPPAAVTEFRRLRVAGRGGRG